MRKLPLILLAVMLAGCQAESSAASINENLADHSDEAVEKLAESYDPDEAPLPYLTEKAAYDWFMAHGFNDIELEYQHDENGDYLEETKIAERYGITEHPVYHASYTDEDGNDWDFYLAGGSITATLKDNPAIAVAESNKIIGFDEENKKFTREVPDESILLIQVGSFMPETLDRALDEAMEKSGYDPEASQVEEEYSDGVVEDTEVLDEDIFDRLNKAVGNEDKD